MLTVTFISRTGYGRADDGGEKWQQYGENSVTVYCLLAVVFSSLLVSLFNQQRSLANAFSNDDRVNVTCVRVN